MNSKKHKYHVGVTISKVKSMVSNDLLNQEEHKSPKIKQEIVFSIKDEKEIPTIAEDVNVEVNNPLKDSPKDNITSDRLIVPKIKSNVKQECMNKRYTENSDPLSAIVERIDNNDFITIE